MDRRDFLRAAGGVTAAAAGAVSSARIAEGANAMAAPAIAAGTRDIRIAIAWPDNRQGPAAGARRLARRIETATGGRYRFHFAELSVAGTSAISSGAADAYFASEHDNRGLSAGFAYFAGLPGFNGLRASALDAWMIAGGGQTLWDELARGHGFKAMLAGHTGRSTGIWSRSPVGSLADLAGKRVWSLALGADVVRGLGAEPISALPGDVAQGLVEGRIDAAEAGGAVASHALGVLDHAKYGTGAAINRGGTALSLGLSRRLWDSMSHADQAIFAALCSAELHTAIAEEKASRHRILAPLKARSVEQPPRDIANAISRVSDAVVAHLAATDAATQRINASYVAFRRAIGLKRVALSA